MTRAVAFVVRWPSTLRSTASRDAPFDGARRRFGENAATVEERGDTVPGISPGPEKIMKSALLTLAVCLFMPAEFSSNASAAEVSTAANAIAETHQFDFLLGEWELQVHPKVSGLAAAIHGTPKLAGTWKAWRVLDGQVVEDELRIVDASGNPVALHRGLRTWSGAESRWKICAVDAYHSDTSESTGAMQAGAMRTQGRFTDANGKTILTRTRYSDVGPDSFHTQQDRSEDNGQTWDEAVLTIDAKRTAATATP
jgi:hypothetical protein